MSDVATLSKDEKFRKYLEAKIIADTKDMSKEKISRWSK